MIVDCRSCGATYNISDDKVRGRRVRVRCKSCGEGIIVDGVKLEADDATRVYSPTFEPASYAAEPTIGHDESTRVMTAGGPEWRPPSPRDWMVNISESEQRTMSLEDLVRDYNGGIVGDDAFVWRDGMTDWLPIREVAEIRSAIEAGEATRVISPAAAVRAPLRPRANAAGAAVSGTGAAAAHAAVTYSAPSAPPRARRSSDPATSVEYDASGTSGIAMAAAVDPPRPPEKTPAVPLPPPRHPPARVRDARPRGADLFGAVETAGGEEALLNSSALQPYDAKPIGARNESSVLFSLDTLKAGARPGARNSSNPPRLVAAAPPTAADILGMTAGGALPGMDPSSSLLSAPVVDAPPRPSFSQPSVPYVASPSGPTPTNPPRSRMDTTPPTMRDQNRTRLMIGAGAAAVVVLLGIVLAARGRSDGPVVTEGKPASAETAAAVVKAPPAEEKTAAPAPTTELVAQTPEPTLPEQPQAQPAKPSPAPSPVKASNPSTQSLEDMKAALRPSKPAEPAKPSGQSEGTSGKLVLAEDPPAPEEKLAAAMQPPAEEAPAEPEKPPFDTAAAKTALETAASSAPSCKSDDGPTGRGKVQVTFSPSGRATSANIIDGPFGGTSIGGCVAKLFRAASVPPFSGAPVTVSKSFTIPE